MVVKLNYSFYLFFLYFFYIKFQFIQCVTDDGISEEETKNIKHLTHEVELQIYSQHSENVIALFCNNKELKCKNAYKEFIEASNELVDNEIVFVYVDTLTLPKTADNFEIKNVPKILTFRDFDPEKGYTFSKKYTKENIIEWFKLLPLPSIEVMDKTNVDKYVELQKKKGYASIIAFAIKNSDNAHKFVHFGETHKIPNLSVGLAYVEKEEETKIEIFNGPGSTIPNDLIRYKDVYIPDNNIWVSDKIYKFTKDYMDQFPIIINYSRKIIRPINNDIYFYIFSNLGDYSESLYAELYNVIKNYPEIKFVFPKSEEKSELFQLEHDMNLVCILDYRNASFDAVYQLLRPKKFIKEIDGDIKSEIVKNFIEDFYNNKITQYRKSQKPIKRREQQHYQIICTNNFESFVFDPERIVLIFYHVQGCKECKPILSFWESVSNYFHLENKYKNVLVATMDAKLNDMIDETVEFFPTLAIYPKGEDKLKRRKVFLFPVKLDTLIDIVDEMLEDIEEDL
ncbi:protein disulfide isomerase, putative [Plasmodium gallinaceum]|uniref:Protein disulfide isomerase, putative n=1 Tax=Plasmodium gallinaceum TaxID=5849 RepID=A0A1J1GWP8_PLAGA|nr:protein disulfide isomerase, putative [Plasmodium gallinaceum]CRG96741.1 protein disulfide isomerase, putative [Plasmodium gallinaceum]